MTQLIPEKILEIIDDHDRAEKATQQNRFHLFMSLFSNNWCCRVYLISTISINVVTIIIMLFGVFMIVIFKSYLDSWSG